MDDKSDNIVADAEPFGQSSSNSFTTQSEEDELNHSVESSERTEVMNMNTEKLEDVRQSPSPSGQLVSFPSSATG